MNMVDPIPELLMEHGRNIPKQRLAIDVTRSFGKSSPVSTNSFLINAQSLLCGLVAVAALHRSNSGSSLSFTKCLNLLGNHSIRLRLSRGAARR